MMSACLISLLVTVASAQYAITDLISDDKTTSGPGSPAAPHPQQTLPQARSSSEAKVLPVQLQNYPGTSSAMPLAVAPSSPTMVAASSPPNTASRMSSLLSGAVANGQGQGPSPTMPSNPMAALLSAVTGAANPQATASQGAESVSGQVLSTDSMAVVSGLVEAFMHKVKLMPGEKSCLESNIGQLTGDVMGTVGDIVTGIKALVAGKGTIGKEASGGVVSAGLDSAMKITSLVSLSTKLFKGCVHGDALVLLNTTAHHLINGTYLQHRFIVNGVDIFHSLSDSIVAFEAHDFNRFGKDIGTSLRKLLLSKATNATRLPEGVPEEVIIQKATDGLMKGFFVSGSAVEITDTAHPDIDIVINLHRCIAGNSAFFKELWMAAWDLIAHLSLNGQQHGLGLQQGAQAGQPKWSSELMVAMMQFPMALSRCGISSDMQNMFMEAIQSLNDLKVRFNFPAAVQGQVADQTREVTDQMAKAVEAWTNWDFEGFGFQLGELLRELVMVAFPQKYSVDASGQLRRYSRIQSVKSSSISASMVIIGGCAMCLLIAFAAVRTGRSYHHMLVEPPRAMDNEDCEVANALVEVE